MKDNKLYNILDLIEEINKVDKMIELHQDSASDLMLKQYQNQKLKLSNLLFKELLTNTDSRTDVMYLIKMFIEKFYQKEIKNHRRFKKEDHLKRIEDVFLEMN
ncbi:hypothetical protein MG290_14010 [Flavobacterium sp. CBA20B-1]|uniref:hypothetical protein n=1 Tax=unclassified Flavobacterium TaxID=196869 RepID=UPI0022250CBD|nr:MULTISPECIES: hypothetical protein [unclassified Flavobacterium]WCM42029.1 hypothetical protein MG290_14010 [Flavobacterium sp. CBA20B-1]